MKLSLKLISLGLNRGDVQIVSTRSTRPDQMRLNSLMLWEQREEWDYSVCYVLDAQEIPSGFRCPDDIALVILGHPEGHTLSRANADILIWDVDRTEMSLRAQFNHLTGVFWHYQNLEARILRRLMDSSPLQELITFGETTSLSPE